MIDNRVKWWNSEKSCNVTLFTIYNTVCRAFFKQSTEKIENQININFVPIADKVMPLFYGISICFPG